MRQKLLDEYAQLKEKLHEKEEEMVVSITKKLQAFGVTKIAWDKGARGAGNRSEAWAKNSSDIAGRGLWRDS